MTDDERRIEGLVDDMVDRWHDDESGGMSIADFLGLDDEQYTVWARRPAWIHEFVAGLPEYVRAALLALAGEMRRPDATDEDRDAACGAVRNIFRREPGGATAVEESLRRRPDPWAVPAKPWTTDVTSTPIADLRKIQEFAMEYAVPTEDAFPHGTTGIHDEIEADRCVLLDEARDEQEGGAGTLEDAYEPGTDGHFEAIARVSVHIDSWEKLVEHHPAVLLDPGLYRPAREVGNLMERLFAGCGGEFVDPKDGPR